jgi:pyruvate/2-oxoglutarate dehydrogenase complex dihydrolipoamide dehydrogenase (E3) component
MQNIATTVFTPLELGTVGLSEEAAIEKYGNGKLHIYLLCFFFAFSFNTYLLT